MTAETMTPAEAQQQALIAELRLMQETLARKEAELDAERAALVEERNNSIQPASDFLQQQLREFRKANEQDDPNNRMNTPCRHVMPDGSECGLAWKTDGEISHPRTHSYRFAQMKTSDEEKGKRYHLSRADMLKYGIEDEAQTLTAAQMYTDVKGAAELLGATQPQVKKLIASGTLAADTIGKTVLVHRKSVDRLVALAEMQQGGEEDA